MQRGTFGRLSQIAPALVIYLVTPLLFSAWPSAVEAISRLTQIYMLLVGLMVIDAALNAGPVRCIRTGLGDIDIAVTDDFGLKDRGDEAYALTSSAGGIRIESASEKGAFQGIMTLQDSTATGIPVAPSSSIITATIMTTDSSSFVAAENGDLIWIPSCVTT